MLVDGLAQTGLLEVADEFFDGIPVGGRRKQWLRELLNRHVSAEGVFGAKVFWHQFQYLGDYALYSADATWWRHACGERHDLRGTAVRTGRVVASVSSRRAPRALLQLLRRLSSPSLRAALQPQRLDLSGVDPLLVHEAVSCLLPNLKYVLLTRNDKLGQAISLVRATQSGQWMVASRAGPSPPTRAWTDLQRRWSINFSRDASGQPQYDAAAIDAALAKLKRWEAQWLTYFEGCGIAPHRLTYEGLCDNRTAGVASVLDFLGIRHTAPISLGNSSLAKQADQLTEQWKRRFEAEPRP